MVFAANDKSLTRIFRTRSQEVAWFQNCLIQCYQYQIFPSFLPSSAYWSVRRLVRSRFRHCRSSTSNPDTTTTEGLLVPVSLFIRSGNRSQKLPSRLPSHHTSLAKLPMNTHRPGPEPITGDRNSGATLSQTDPQVHLSDRNYPGEAGGLGNIIGVLSERSRCLLGTHTRTIDVHKQVLESRRRAGTRVLSSLFLWLPLHISVLLQFLQ